MQLGIFGGTFNPIHNGHLQMAAAVYEILGLDRIYFVPSFIPAQKDKGVVHADHRKAMVGLAIQDLPWATLDTIEYAREGASYTIDTVLELQKRYPEADLYLIIGEDSLQTLHTWHRWQDILTQIKLVVLPRKTALTEIHPEVQQYIVTDKTQFMQAKQGIYRLETALLDVSSTQIRSQLKDKTWLPEPVSAYIKQHHLYF